jgi:hypothetical protein
VEGKARNNRLHILNKAFKHNFPGTQLTKKKIMYVESYNPNRQLKSCTRQTKYSHGTGGRKVFLSLSKDGS